jgi:large subunit ribosomal protein L21
MIAVVDIQGQQFKVTENEKYYVPKLKAEPESDIKFDSVLAVIDEKKTQVGNPYIKNFSVSAKVLEHVKDEKLIVFKKKRRTGYEKKNGHRQQLTRIEITKIG